MIDRVDWISSRVSASCLHSMSRYTDDALVNMLALTQISYATQVWAAQCEGLCMRRSGRCQNCMYRIQRAPSSARQSNSYFITFARDRSYHSIRSYFLHCIVLVSQAASALYDAVMSTVTLKKHIKIQSFSFQCYLTRPIRSLSLFSGGHIDLIFLTMS